MKVFRSKPLESIVYLDKNEVKMPSQSKKQEKLMNIAAHTPGGYGGVSQKVGKEFQTADKAKGDFKKKKSTKDMI